MQYEAEIERLRRIVDKLTTPQLGVPLFDLDVFRSLSAEEAMPLDIPKNANSVTLILHFNDRQHYPIYEVEIFDQHSSLIWLGKGKSEGNKMNLSLPRRFITSGRFIIKLIGLMNDKKVPVAEYAVVNDPPLK